ncbi:TetR/AcrR family transcriptional regulator [Prauserella cavernicola]|uniref:TetR family transcriptional regulator n=1 Tax=Prauserella cavernicola TaxID=2800127 RepID=A0A934QWP1_9PSEU|nr:TetR/AcrR family transcriptional regulator [Prauserella cavernicola]MBK1786683.1 TetR family transcriptional regulator [Prauserella cavernicola]
MESATTPGLRERKKRQTRRDLHLAALRLVLDNGLEHVTVDEISAEAGYAPRTFFNHFPTKEAALIIEMGERVTDLFADLPERIEPKQLVATVLDAVVRQSNLQPAVVDDVKAHHRLMERHPELVPQQLRAFESAEQLLVEELLRRGGGDSAWPGAEVAASIVTSLMRVALQRWIRDDGERPFADFLRTAVGTARELTAEPLTR